VKHFKTLIITITSAYAVYSSLISYAVVGDTLCLWLICVERLTIFIVVVVRQSTSAKMADI